MPPPLPPSFAHSFWSQDYRSGLETLYGKLEQGVAENDEISAFLRHRAAVTRDFAQALASQTPSATGQGFAADEGAGLVFAFRGLQVQDVTQAQVYARQAEAVLENLAIPFERWARAHADRLGQSRTVVLDGWIAEWEAQTADIDKLKTHYHVTSVAALSAEDEARFVGASSMSGSSTPQLTSPTTPTAPVVGGASLTRSGTLAQRLVSVSGSISRNVSGVLASGTLSGSSILPATSGKTVFEATTQAFSPKMSPALEKGELAASLTTENEAAAPSVPSRAFLLAGLSLSNQAATSLLQQARSTLPNRTVNLPILGEYEGCFAGWELVAFLLKNVEGFGGNEAKAIDAARELVEVFGLIRRITAVGKATWGGGGDEFYQFTDKPFDPTLEAIRQQDSLSSGTAAMSPASGVSALTRSNTLTSFFSSAMAPQEKLLPHVAARRAADAAEETYRNAVDKLDRTRTKMEEVIEEGLAVLQRWEADRLKAIKTVLEEYHAVTSGISTALQPSYDTSKLLLDSYSPESELSATISRYRTGDFRPQARTFECQDRNDISAAVFGIDLRRWAAGKQLRSSKDEGSSIDQAGFIPEPLAALLNALKEGYAGLSDDAEKRRIWIYEVPLVKVHALRANLQRSSDGTVPSEALKNDLPVLAAAVKLWLLELNPSLGPEYEDVKAVYPSRAGTSQQAPEDNRTEELKSLLARLPKVKLVVLDSIVSHLRSLLDETQAGEEGDDVFLAKIGLALGRAIVRPEKDTPLSIDDRAPSSFIADLVQLYPDILPPVVAARMMETERVVPSRKNTAPIDHRRSRSSLSPEELAELQRLGGRSPMQSTFPSSPRSSGPPRNENAARIEDEAKPRVVEKPKRSSLGRLKTSKDEELLPQGFSIIPPTPIEQTSPPLLVAASPPQVAPAVTPEVTDGVKEHPGLTEPHPPGPTPEAEELPRPFAPPAEDEGQSRPFSPPEEDKGQSKHSAPSAEAEGGTSPTSLSRRTSLDKTKPRGVRVGGVAGPRGARARASGGGAA